MAKAKKKTAKKPKRRTAKKVKVAFVGAGGMANRVHYPSLNDMNDVEIVAICELNEQRLNATADKYNVSGRFNDYREMIEKTDPDAVYVIMPPHHMYDIVANCMDMKRHVFVEKPPSLVSEQTRQMAIIAERNGCLTATGFQRRFSPVIRTAKKKLEKRGPIHSCVATFNKNSGFKPYSNGAIDILTSDAIHAVDTLRYMAGGNVVSVASDVRRLMATHHTSHYALVTFDSGATGILMTNWMTGRRFFTVEMHAPDMSLYGDPEEGGRIYADGQKEPIETLDPAELAGREEDYRAYGFYDENRHFIDCIKKGKLPETNFEDALKTMELVDKIYASQI